MAAIQWCRYQAVSEDDFGRRWLQIQADLGLAQNTVDAYARGLDEYLQFLRRLGVPAISAGREAIAGYLAFLRKPLDEAGRVVCASSPARLSNATM
jgi:integrase/recombinase XerD